ncbi:13934_t:CDS:2 [Entrophospora sp. SA101]|nr:13934_t:CDS:2 [Entrophospora sp. SA101]
MCSLMSDQIRTSHSSDFDFSNNLLFVPFQNNVEFNKEVLLLKFKPEPLKLRLG